MMYPDHGKLATMHCRKYFKIMQKTKDKRSRLLEKIEGQTINE